MVTNNKNLNKQREKRKFSLDARIDYAVLLPVFLLILVGLYALYVAVSHDYPGQAMAMVAQQGTWVVVGSLIAIIVMHLDSRLLWSLTPIFYVLGLGLMVLPLFFYSAEVVKSTGAKNWVTIGGTNIFQPSEFMKISYIVFLARIIVSFQTKLKERYLKDDWLLILRLFIFTVPVAILLGLQSDFGTFLVFLMILFGLILVSGVSWKILAPTILTVAAFAGIAITLIAYPWGQKLLVDIGLHQYQVNRFISWLHPYEFARTISYQQSQALTAIGSGGLTGNGFNVTNVAVPVRESDMIFTVIAEDFGFIGSVGVILLYFILIYRMIRVTIQSNNQYYVYVSTGIIMMILFHVFENIGASIGVLPLTGIPLPFISQGGSSLMSNLIGIGLILSMKYNQLPEFISKDHPSEHLVNTSLINVAELNKEIEKVTQAKYKPVVKSAAKNRQLINEEVIKTSQPQLRRSKRKK